MSRNRQARSLLCEEFSFRMRGQIRFLALERPFFRILRHWEVDLRRMKQVFHPSSVVRLLKKLWCSFRCRNQGELATGLITAPDSRKGSYRQI
jgi:hypothetical protein